MTQLEAMRKLAATKTPAAYDDVVAEIKAEHGGQFPEWYHAAIILSGFAHAKSLSW